MQHRKMNIEILDKSIVTSEFPFYKEPHLDFYYT